MTTKPVSGRAIAWLSAMSGLWLTAGCATPMAPEADGPPPRFHDWWSYYERATARRDNGNIAGARNDFERCLDLRPGATFGMDEERWRIRTYGLHFINGYFPNRELGVCWYELGDFTNAEHFLARSLEKEPSGRAKYYLNLARAALLKSAAVEPPQIHIDAACLPALTRARVRRISGVAAGAGFISDISINGERLLTELASTNLASTRTSHSRREPTSSWSPRMI
jgi:tetratricopeptide (TPR) repeat protein